MLALACARATYTADVRRRADPGAAATRISDISSIALARKKAPHSWHQDSGLRQRTVLLGFPIEDAYDGAGVFSHVVKLSNELSPNPGRSRGAIVEWERFDADGNGSR